MEILSDWYLIILSVCNKCKHFDVFEYTCPAFPKSIPDGLLDGSIRHDESIKGQKGKTVFKPQ
jgi:hypothetical protein